MNVKCEIDNGNCYNQGRKCRFCTHNLNAERQDGEQHIEDCYITPLDKVDELYRYLKGEGLPEGVECPTPKLSPEMAFHVIRFLQEITNCLPDYIERCNGCGELYDSERSGYYLDDQYADKKTGKTLAKKYWGSWCDGCVPNVEFYVK